MANIRMLETAKKESELAAENLKLIQTLDQILEKESPLVYPVRKLQADKRTAMTDVDVARYAAGDILKKGELSKKVASSLCLETIAGSVVINDDTIMQDPYVQAVKPSGKTVDGLQFTEKVYQKGEISLFAPFEQGKAIIPTIGIHCGKATVPQITDGGRELYTLSPAYMAGMGDAIFYAHGNVLAAGLGMGYFAYLASESSKVRTVTIVEKDEHLIRLFERDILPQFPNKEKIRVLCTDPMFFLNTVDPDAYHFYFVDLCENARDISTYLKVKEATRNYSQKTIVHNEAELVFRTMLFVKINLYRRLSGLEEARDGKKNVVVVRTKDEAAVNEFAQGLRVTSTYKLRMLYDPVHLLNVLDGANV